MAGADFPAVGDLEECIGVIAQKVVVVFYKYLFVINGIIVYFFILASGESNG